MIAQELFTDEAIATRSGTRAGRARAELRRRKTLARRYRNVRHVVVSVTTATIVVVSYLGLLASITQMNYERAEASQRRDALAVETDRLENRIAQLESRDRLATVAASLGMHDAATFSVAHVTIDPTPPSPPHGLALIAGWLR